VTIRGFRYRTVHHFRWSLAIAALTATVGWEGVRVVHGYSAKRASLVSRHWRVTPPQDEKRLGLANVVFPSRDGARLQGWYIASRTGAAVILCDGADADRSSMLDDARPLALAGLGVLMFDWPGRGESQGRVALDAPERSALEGAVDFVTAREDVDPRRIGALGFSWGGYSLAQVAAHDRRIRAIVLAATPADLTVQSDFEYERGGWAPQWGARLALRIEGPPLTHLRPLTTVAMIAPRPIVIVTGTDDPTVPAWMSRVLFKAAREPKQLWIVAHAGHGLYERVDPAYGGRLAGFFRATLEAP
jgi:fermentation-respiration switch protein FrsA (DUF1100 family)